MFCDQNQGQSKSSLFLSKREPRGRQGNEECLVWPAVGIRGGMGCLDDVLRVESS